MTRRQAGCRRVVIIFKFKQKRKKPALADRRDWLTEEWGLAGRKKERQGMQPFGLCFGTDVNVSELLRQAKGRADSSCCS